MGFDLLVCSNIFLMSPPLLSIFCLVSSPMSCCLFNSPHHLRICMFDNPGMVPHYAVSPQAIPSFWSLPVQGKIFTIREFYVRWGSFKLIKRFLRLSQEDPL